MDIELDFSWVENFKKSEAAAYEAEIPATLQREFDRRSKEVQAHAEKQDAMGLSEGLQAEILKGLERGTDIYNLFLKAAKAIALMTANPMFYDRAEADIKAVYGRGLHEEIPLHMELEEARERLKNLTEAEKIEDDIHVSKKIKNAVRANIKLIERLEIAIQQNT